MDKKWEIEFDSHYRGHWEEKHLEDIKDFISQTLAKQREEIRGKIEEMKKKPKLVQKFSWPDAFGNSHPTTKKEEYDGNDEIYNQAIQDMSDVINKENE